MTDDEKDRSERLERIRSAEGGCSQEDKKFLLAELLASRDQAEILSRYLVTATKMSADARAELAILRHAVELTKAGGTPAPPASSSPPADHTGK